MLISVLTYCKQTVKNLLDRLKKAHQTLFTSYYQDSIGLLEEELEDLVKEFPENFTVSMLLANIMRNRGEIERAVKLRTDVLHACRDTLAADKKNKLLYELGRDYLAGGFLGRARDTLEQVREGDTCSPLVLKSLAETYASLGDLDQCVKLYGQLGQKIPRGHFLVQLAREARDRGEDKKYEQLLNRALDTAPGLAEGYIEKCLYCLQEDKLPELAQWFEAGLKRVDPRLYLLFFEYLLPRLDPLACQALLPVVEAMPFDITIFFYRSFLHTLLEERDKARECLQNCLEHDPEFWPARLELISLDCQDVSLPPQLRHELDTLLGKGRTLKKFFCTHCGLRREQVFLQCPRCKQWQTISLLKPTWPA